MAEEGAAPASAPAAEGKKAYNPDPNAMPPKGEQPQNCCTCCLSKICCYKPVDPHAPAEPHKCPTSIKRSYTDCLAFLLLIACWVITTGVGISAMSGTLVAIPDTDPVEYYSGNVDALIAPTDYKGRICGVDSAVSSKPYGYVVDKYGDVVCVEECPSKSASPDVSMSAYDNLKDYCMKDEVADKYKDATSTDTEFYDYATLLGTSSSSEYLEGPCMMELGSFYLGFYCAFNPDSKVPMINYPGGSFNVEGITNETITSIITGNGKSATSYMADFLSDLIVCRNAIFGFGFAVALIVALVYSYLMTLGFVDCVVWSCILLTFCIFFGLGGYMYSTYAEWAAVNCDDTDDGTDCQPDAHSDSEIDGMMYLSYIFFAMAALWAAFIACICSKIQLACAFVKIAGTAVRDVNIALFFPIVQLAGLVLFLVPWMYYMAYIYSQGHYQCVNECDDGEDKCNGMNDGRTYSCGEALRANATKYSWEWADTSIGSDADLATSWMMFSYFWTSQFISAVGQLVMAMTFVLWYFSGFDADQEEQIAVKTAEMDGESISEKKKPGCLRRCICGDPDNYRGNGLFFKGIHLVLYHIGTAAAGSLIIAIIQFIRYMVAKIQAQCNKNLTGTAKTIANIVLCCIQCCLYCLEKCMKFINKHAYIITAVKGSSFCVAACASFWLIVRNIRLIAALTVVQEFSIVIGKVLIIMCTGFLSYYYMAASDLVDRANSLIGPTLFVMILAFFIADMFMGTYSMAMDVMMHCYLSDKESNTPMWAVNEKATHLKPLGALLAKHAPKDDDKEEPKEKL